MYPILENQMNCHEIKMDSTQRYGVDVDRDQQVPTMKKVKVPVIGGEQNKALNCTHCKVTCHYLGNSNISTAESSSCPAFEMEDMDDVEAALESDFVSVSWACKMCPGHCLGRVHRYEDFKWDHVEEEQPRILHDVCENSEDSMDQNEEGIRKSWKKDMEQLMVKHEKAMEEINQRLDVLEMKALAPDPPTTWPENVQEMMTSTEEDNKKPVGEDEKIVKSLCDTTMENSKSTEQISSIEPLKCKLEFGSVISSGFYRALFRGSFNGEKVAIKRVRADRTKFQSKENKILGQFNHPNVIKLFQVTQDVNYRFSVLELAAGTVDDFCTRIYDGKMPSDAEALKQMAAGLLYIHGKRFAHLNINPYSVFISTSEPVRLMIAQFSSYVATTDTGTFAIGCYFKGSADVWMAPEIFEFFYYYDGYGDEQPVDSFSIASDIWSLGCLFFNFLTRGVHPYGDDNDIIPWKILMKKTPVKLEEAMQASNQETSPVYELIRDMIETEPGKRISLGNVVKSLETLFPASVTA